MEALRQDKRLGIQKAGNRRSVSCSAWKRTFLTSPYEWARIAASMGIHPIVLCDLRFECCRGKIVSAFEEIDGRFIGCERWRLRDQSESAGCFAVLLDHTRAAACAMVE